MKKSIDFRVYDQLPDESKAIREEVFVVEQGFSEEFDTVDKYAVHILAYDVDGKAIGTCRIFEENEPGVMFLGRLAVCAEYREAGVGSMLLQQAQEYAASIGIKEIKLHSQLRAKGFYEKNGYNAYGEIEDDEGCPHIWMTKKVGQNSDVEI